MKKRTHRTGYFIKEGFSSIFTHGFMSFASVTIIVACLIIMGTFVLLALNINSLVADLESQNEMLAYVDETLTEEEARALQPQLEALPNVASVEFMSRDEAMDDFMAQYEDDSLFEDLDSSILRDRYTVHLDDLSLMSQTQRDLLTVTGIAKVNAHTEIARGFITVRNIVSIVSVVLVAILFVVSLSIMSNTIKLATFDRREEIAIMKMVGATNSFIRWPFVWEGLILGLTGALLAFLIQWGIYSLIADRISASSLMTLMTVIPFKELAVPIVCVFLGMGFIVGVGGSLMAIRKFLKV